MVRYFALVDFALCGSQTHNSIHMFRPAGPLYGHPISIQRNNFLYSICSYFSISDLLVSGMVSGFFVLIPIKCKEKTAESIRSVY